MVRETKNYWYYDIRIAENWDHFPDVRGYEYLQDVRPVTNKWLIKIKKTSDVEDVDWRKFIYGHFASKYGEKWRKIRFIRF
jgi:hypothetical protein